MPRDLFAEAGIEPTNKPRDLFAEAGLTSQEPTRQPRQRPAGSDFLLAAGHNFMKPIHSAANLIEQGAAGLALAAAPESDIANWLGKTAMSDQEATQLAEQQYQQSVLDSAASYAGATVGAIAPYTLTGAQQGLKAVGDVGASALQKVTPQFMQNFAGNIGAGAVQGLAIGAATAPSLEQMPSSAAIGAGTGAVVAPTIPALVGGAKWLLKYPYHLIEPYLPNGEKQIVGRTLNRAAGEAQPLVISELKSAESGLTAGQAAVRANSPQFSALQEKVKSVNPAPYDAIKQSQEADRLASMRSIGRDSPNPDAPKPNITNAQNARKVMADRIYGDAYAADDMRISALLNKAMQAKGGIAQGDVSPIPLDSRLVNLTKNKIITDVAEQVSSETPQYGDPITNLRGLDQIKKMIDEDLFAIKNKQPTAIKNATEANLVNAKSQLLYSMEKLNPTYGKARKIYGDMSAPINQMQIGTMLEDALSNTVGVTERGTVFANKIKDAERIIKTTTGQTRYDKLSELFTPSQMGKVSRVIYELNRDARLNELSKEGLSAINKQLGDTSHEIRPPNWLDRGMQIANTLIRRIQGGAGEKSLQELSVIMQNPKLSAQLMEQANTKEKNVLKLLQGLNKVNPVLIQSISQQNQQ